MVQPGLASTPTISHCQQTGDATCTWVSLAFAGSKTPNGQRCGAVLDGVARPNTCPYPPPSSLRSGVHPYHTPPSKDRWCNTYLMQSCLCWIKHSKWTVCGVGQFLMAQPGLTTYPYPQLTSIRLLTQLKPDPVMSLKDWQPQMDRTSVVGQSSMVQSGLTSISIKTPLHHTAAAIHTWSFPACAGLKTSDELSRCCGAALDGEARSGTHPSHDPPPSDCDSGSTVRPRHLMDKWC